MTISIAAYGLGNIKSIQNIISKLGVCSELVTNPNKLRAANKIILPGVGNFDAGIKQLHDGAWADELNEAVIVRKVPILGICLGMQMMCRSSEEGRLPGLGWIDAEVQLIKRDHNPSLKVPHMGWNTISIKKHNALLNSEHLLESRFYFVHSYHAVCENSSDVIATTNYGGELTVAFNRENIYGVQFHPEKSHRFGIDLFRNFLAI
jgi:glutamine amidotransferase